jgi:hypothetical protein
MIFVVPDIRVLQNVAYALLLVFAKLDWTVVNQGIVVLGGACWAAATVGFRRRTTSVQAGSSQSRSGDAHTTWLARWGKTATYIAVIMPMPYGITRLAWALGMPMGLDQHLGGAPVHERIGEAALGLLAIGGGILTLGLVRPWGEVWPRWVVFLADRRVPVAVPTVAAGLAATVITIGGFALLRIGIMEELGILPEATPADFTGWGASAPGWLFPVWGVALGVATIGYASRRRRSRR